MPIHYRHTRASEGNRAAIAFTRRDYLWHHPHPIVSPHGKKVCVDRLPIQVGEEMLVGPTILDMMVRDVPEDDTEPVVWSIRDPDSLWPAPKRKKPPRREPGQGERARHHPFLPGLASGGLPVIGPDHHDFVLVEKRSVISIAPHAYRLAIGMHGSVDAAYTAIAHAAAKAWDDDIARSLVLWDRLNEAGGQLEETTEIAVLRPESSISQQIERAIMREVCVWLGVDPDLDFSRPRGRPRAAPGDEGEIIKIDIVDDVVTGELRRDFQRWKRGQALADLTVIELTQLLGALRTDGHEPDADLLEAYLDAAAHDWREQAAAGLGEPANGPAVADPYEVLGVERTATMEEITSAYRRAMLAVHPDTAGIGSWFVRAVADAYRNIKQERST